MTIYKKIDIKADKIWFDISISKRY